MKKLFVLISVCLILPLTVKAQRTSYGANMVAASFGTSFSHIGGELMYGQYLLHSYWFGAVSYYNYMELESNTKQHIHYPRLCAKGGFMYRAYGNYDRTINFYGGLDAFVGVEMFDLYKTLSEEIRNSFKGYKDYCFIYGFAPRAEAEYFFLSELAAIATFRIPFTFNSPFSNPIFGWELSIGIKYNF